MAWDFGQPSRRAFQSANIGGRDFWLVPKGESIEGFLSHPQASLPELLTFNHPDISRYQEYKYKALPQDKKRIRLMKLYPGEASGAEIHCELLEAEYDRDFHIPTNIQGTTAPNRNDGSRPNSRSASQDEEDEGERSDLETRCQEKIETTEERLARKKREEVRQLLTAVKELKKDPEREKAQDEEKFQKRVMEWKEVKKREVQYEALSWCWGDDKENYVVLIHMEDRTFRKPIRKELALALKYLRRPGKERILWIDAICINQASPNERNHQVQMMSRIYTRARQVCIWLGEADADSETAINFIKDEIKELKNFDTISSNEQYSRKWQALMSLMQRDWFFRRWVVQEIALSSAATVYCGPHSVPWKSFAVAVELFVEVETATHRLSEVMKRDEKFRHVPGWFEYVSELGASLLVQATGKVFRTKRSPMQPNPNTYDEDAQGSAKHDEAADLEKRKKKEEEEEKIIEERLRETQTIDPLERRSLLSLEYLVSTMFIFQASEPRDVVYALLAIARDASPFAPAHYGQDDQKLFLVMTLLDRFLAEKPFTVDYNRPYSDVSRDFVEFSIARTNKTDPHQALDILCRPWALDAPKTRSKRLNSAVDSRDGSKRRLMPKRRAWKRREMQIEKKDNGTWEEDGRRFRFRYIDNQSPGWVNDPRENKTYCTEAERLWSSACVNSECTHTRDPKCPLIPWIKFKKKYFPSSEDPSQAEQDISLPSWVALASQAPFMLDHAPGMDMRKTSRANADPLVGSPLYGHRNYSAAGSAVLDHTTLKFKRRPVIGHYSLYTKGFTLDEVDLVEDASQLGSIPRAWLDMGGWKDLSQDPPDEFWRTIVADRGRENRNPPYYYARACKESVHKGSHLGGSVNTTALINDEQNSIIAEFCRRVHAVIWNRCLFKTKQNRLGLGNSVKVGDKVCILYGCTVPVILRESEKKKAQFQEDGISDLEREAEEDRVETLKACVRRAISNRERKAKYRPKKKDYTNAQWDEMRDARMAYLEEKGEEKKDTEKENNEQISKAKAKENRKDFKKRLAEQIQEADKEKEEAEKKIRDAKQIIKDAKKAAQDAAGDNTAVQEANDKTTAAQTAIIQAEKAEKAGVEKRNQALQEAEDAVQKAEEGLQAVQPLEGSGKPMTSFQAFINETQTQTSDNEVRTVGTRDTTMSDKEPWNDFSYKFMGECYLHGMMDGEAMREKFHKGLDDWIFELR